MKQFINDLQACIPVYLNNAIDFICKIKNDLYLKSIHHDYLEQIEYLNLKELRYFLKNNSELLPEKISYQKNLNKKEVDKINYEYYLLRLENLDDNYFENLDKLEFEKIKKMCELETKKEIELSEKNKIYLKITKNILEVFLNCLKIILVEKNKNIILLLKLKISLNKIILLLIFLSKIKKYILLTRTKFLFYLFKNSLKYFVSMRKNLYSL